MAKKKKVVRKGKKKRPQRPSSQKWKLYKITEDGKVIRLRPFCPRCGPGVFLADHGDRWACGKCGYTEWKTKEQQQKEEKK